MQTKWICSSTFLPYAGEPVDFRLEEREQPIHGFFLSGSFHSRWAEYDARRVRSWRHTYGGPSAEQIVAPKVTAAGASVTTLRWLAKVLFKGRTNAAVESPHRRHARTTGKPAIPLRQAAAAMRHSED